MKLFIGLILVCLIGAFLSWNKRAVEQPAGVLVSDQPVQKNLPEKRTVFEKEGFKITPLAEFKAEARVLLREDYFWDDGAAIAPVDLALGWGRMSDNDVLEHLEFSQSNRFYYWSTADFPIPRREIETHSANMHMIPASRTVEKQLKKVRQGNIVRFEGYLVEVYGENGWLWRSSLTRDDTGNGACELIWVEKLEVF
ncbi:MAG: hypothetical protein V2J55_07050 [Candidatus Competibacteraceae bacterium]|jgi:hypothetical protein|nr:hypothetical protein [Candidatus Competibacteraceae bacterium]